MGYRFKVSVIFDGLVVLYYLGAKDDPVHTEAAAYDRTVLNPVGLATRVRGVKYYYSIDSLAHNLIMPRVVESEYAAPNSSSTMEVNSAKDLLNCVKNFLGLPNPIPKRYNARLNEKSLNDYFAFCKIGDSTVSDYSDIKKASIEQLLFANPTVNVNTEGL